MYLDSPQLSSTLLEKKIVTCCINSQMKDFIYIGLLETAFQGRQPLLILK